MEHKFEALLIEIREYLNANQNPATVQKYARYFVEGYDAYGVDQKALDVQKRAWLADNREALGLDGFILLGDQLVAGSKYEEVFLAYWFVKQFKEHLDIKVFPHLASWLENGICNWAMVDSFSMDIVAPFLIKGVVHLEDMAAWRTSQSKWMRRAVPVSLIKPLQAGMSIETVFEFIAPLMLDREKVVQQGLRWLLREMWKLSPEAAENYLLEWKDTCARLIIQYATEKMTKEQKLRFQRHRLRER